MSQKTNTTAAQAQATAQEPAQAQDEHAKVEFKGRNIVSVWQPKGAKNRYCIEVDGEPFDSYDNEGKAVETNTFSIELYTLMKQAGRKCDWLNLAFTMASVNPTAGKLNPQIVGLCLNGAQIAFTREHKDATDLRETGVEGDTYGKNVWKTTITDLVPNIQPAFLAMLQTLITNPNTLVLADKQPTVADMFAQAQALQAIR